MLTILADAMFTATLTKRGSGIPEHLKSHADRYVPNHERNRMQARFSHNPYRDLW
ncbi:hypothetical protein OAN307_c48250 [Octadecabacter antarcticus 307]|uniref:Uncharacterized protein n=1 Tax=Octadecabacter antarcticus 307 TaxID=391626 RepID=M9RK05_9RHOB|nr:hypothetical protein [Octadecabacter antarcticus]AGI70170.1 hypothetical protein OAN307_c48250 [Octadecabacter antarcticus 307]